MKPGTTSFKYELETKLGLLKRLKSNQKQKNRSEEKFCFVDHCKSRRLPKSENGKGYCEIHSHIGEFAQKFLRKKTSTLENARKLWNSWEKMIDPTGFSDGLV